MHPEEEKESDRMSPDESESKNESKSSEDHDPTCWDRSEESDDPK